MDWDEIDPQDTNVIMHVYRGEVQRINTWRRRMDRTTNWAVVITVGVITFALSNVNTPHWTLFPGVFLTYVLLFTEARRYRHYDAWRGRVRALEEMFLAKFFDREMSIPGEWEEVLSEDLRDPKYKISWQEAVKRRMKRIYMWIIFIFLAAWISKIYLHPDKATSVGEFFGRVGGPFGAFAGGCIFAAIVGSAVISTLYFLLWPPEREAKGTGEPEITGEFVTDEYMRKFREQRDKSSQQE